MGQSKKNKTKNNQRRRYHKAASKGAKAGRNAVQKNAAPVSAGRRALLGGDVSGSYSKVVHGLISGGAYEYDLISLPPANDAAENAAALRSILADARYDGFNVTVPYKRTVVELLDGLSEEAAALGAVNTVRREADGTLTGFNTDLYGFVQMVGRARAEGRRAAVLGTGGAASAAAEGLRRLGASEVVLVSRNASQAAQDDIPVLGYDELTSFAPAVLVNATPVGMGALAEQSPLESLEAFPPETVVAIDLIYNPLRTRFLQDAAAAGAEPVSGLSMLIYQAMQARDLWDASKERTLRGVHDTAAQAAATILKDQLNIVVIGMPGSGKSSIARRLAKLMQRTFIDTDRLTEELLGEPIPNVIRDPARGERHFREKEREAVCRACAGHGAVIATGGGAVMDPVSRRAMRSNGIVVYLNRPIEMLAQRDRPISQAKGVERIFEERQATYEALADLVVVNNRRFGATRTADGRMQSYNKDLNDFAAGLERQVDEYVTLCAQRIAGTAEPTQTRGKAQ
ncbi:MAG: hypothetical protein IJH91_10240 [Mogibacterium sp.]|nr:hypothetical protein [Mogibacterium sp.]